MKIKLFFILFLFLIYRPLIPGGDCPISGNLLFEAKKIAFYIEVKDKDFSEDLLKECLYYEKVDHADIVLLQSHLETGNYTSEVFLLSSNLFGMKYPIFRETTAVGILLHHAYYNHWTDSVKDYKLWQDWYKSVGYNMDEYLVFLKFIRYAKDPRYIHKLIYLAQKDIT
jgi:hypothetical protein